MVLFEIQRRFKGHFLNEAFPLNTLLKSTLNIPWERLLPPQVTIIHDDTLMQVTLLTQATWHGCHSDAVTVQFVTAKPLPIPIIPGDDETSAPLMCLPCRHLDTW